MERLHTCNLLRNFRVTFPSKRCKICTTFLDSIVSPFQVNLWFEFNFRFVNSKKCLMLFSISFFSILSWFMTFSFVLCKLLCNLWSFQNIIFHLKCNDEKINFYIKSSLSGKKYVVSYQTKIIKQEKNMWTFDIKVPF